MVICSNLEKYDKMLQNKNQKSKKNENHVCKTSSILKNVKNLHWWCPLKFPKKNKNIVKVKTVEKWHYILKTKSKMKKTSHHVINEIIYQEETRLVIFITQIIWAWLHKAISFFFVLCMLQSTILLPSTVTSFDKVLVLLLATNHT